MRPFADPNDRYSYEDWMNEMGADEGLPELPPMGHPLQKLGARLGELLDEDHWAECERLLLEGWAHDEIDRKTGQHWRENSDLQVWFPMTAEELERLRAENAELRHNVHVNRPRGAQRPRDPVERVVGQSHKTTQVKPPRAARRSRARLPNLSRPVPRARLLVAGFR